MKINIINDPIIAISDANTNTGFKPSSEWQDLYNLSSNQIHDI